MEKGITSALLDIGGNIQAISSRPDGTDWQLGIRNPFGEGTLGVLSAADKAVVTSGNNGAGESEQWISGQISGIKAVDMIDEAIRNYKKQYRE